ncbi:MAG: hypothetical protein ACM3X7_01020 [Solirubrobacterales bacterium]
MKKVLLIMLISVLAIFAAGCTKSSNTSTNTNTEETDKKAVVSLVEDFGKKLQMVSLLADKDQVSKSMQDNYSNYVSAELIEKWKANPTLAPGRMVSSPWPDRIEIISNEKVSEGDFKVTGNIIEITSTEASNGGAAAKRPISLEVKKIENRWWITGVTLGEYEESRNPVYKNTQYGFTFSLPKTWKGYTTVTDKWEGVGIGSDKVLESGPIILLRHPSWSEAAKRQDIPIMVFTTAQWDMLKNEKFHIGAAPIGPKELGRNSKYVLALPARYNFAFLPGYEEVENILNNNALKASDNDFK